MTAKILMMLIIMIMSLPPGFIGCDILNGDDVGVRGKTAIGFVLGLFYAYTTYTLFLVWIN